MHSSSIRVIDSDVLQGGSNVEKASNPFAPPPQKHLAFARAETARSTKLSNTQQLRAVVDSLEKPRTLNRSESIWTSCSVGLLCLTQMVVIPEIYAQEGFRMTYSLMPSI